MRRLALLGCAALLLAPAAARAQRLSAWIQLDYQHGQESVDQLNDADGRPLNQNRFLIPRTRLKLSEEWSVFELVAEADFNTVRGPQVGPRQLELALTWPPHPTAPFPNPRFATARPPKPAPADAGVAPAPPPPAAPEAPDAGVPAPPEEPPAPAAGDASPPAEPPTDGGAPEAPATAAAAAPAPPPPPPAPAPAPPPPAAAEKLADRFPLQLRLGGGIFRAPFGHDVYELSHADRLFSQPSLLAQAFFPGEFDLGARLSARWRGIGLVLAMQNGEPLGSRAFPAEDPNADKDFFARLTVDAEPARWLSLSAGASAMAGTGFHPGTPATKDTLVWRDLNEDGIAQLSELQAIRGSAATPSENFPRWGVAGDLRILVRHPHGRLLLFGEAALGHNLDRGVRPADPVLSGRAQRGVAAFAGFTEELFGRLLVGFRVDHYLAAIDDARFEAGTLVRAQEPFTNYSFALGYGFGDSLPFGKGRLLVEYTLRRDPLGRDATGRPADLENDLFTVRLQLEL